MLCSLQGFFSGEPDLPSVVRDWLIEQASLSLSPVAPLLLLRSLPAGARWDQHLLNSPSPMTLHTLGAILDSHFSIRLAPVNAMPSLLKAQLALMHTRKRG